MKYQSMMCTMTMKYMYYVTLGLFSIQICLMTWNLMVMNHPVGEDIVYFNHDLLRSIGLDDVKDRLLILTQKKKHLHRTKCRTKEVRQIYAETQSAIMERVNHVGLDETKLLLWTNQAWSLCHRSRLVERGFLLADAPAQGLDDLSDTHRTASGTQFLSDAKDMLWASLFGDDATNVRLERVQRELLVITVPKKKAHAFNFLQAATEVGALGTWRDPDSVSDDADAPNMLLQVEYGDLASEAVGDTIMVCIHIINLLQVNEQLLYARSSNVEQSTLLTELYFEKRKLQLSKRMQEAVVSISQAPPIILPAQTTSLES